MKVRKKNKVKKCLDKSKKSLILHPHKNAKRAKGVCKNLCRRRRSPKQKRIASKWRAVFVKSNHERSFAKELTHHGITSFVPLQEVRRRREVIKRNGKEYVVFRSVKRVVFRCYAFFKSRITLEKVEGGGKVKLVEKEWDLPLVFQTKGFTRLLPLGNYKLLGKQLDAIKEHFRVSKSAVLRSFKEGLVVIPQAGAYANQQLRIIRVREKDIAVLPIDAIGMGAEIELQKRDLEDCRVV